MMDKPKVATSGGYAGRAKTYEEVVADKQHFMDRLKYIYDFIGMDFWMVGTADVEEREPIVALVRKLRRIGYVRFAQGVSVGLILGGLVVLLIARLTR